MNISVSVNSKYLPSEDESNHSRKYSLSDISSLETSTDDTAPIQQQPSTQAARQSTTRQAQSSWDSDFHARQQVLFSGSLTGLRRQITTQNPAHVPIALLRSFF